MRSEEGISEPQSDIFRFIPASGFLGRDFHVEELLSHAKLRSRLAQQCRGPFGAARDIEEGLCHNFLDSRGLKGRIGRPSTT
jgi:hypothetical protein